MSYKTLMSLYFRMISFPVCVLINQLKFIDFAYRVFFKMEPNVWKVSIFPDKPFMWTFNYKKQVRYGFLPPIGIV